MSHRLRVEVEKVVRAPRKPSAIIFENAVAHLRISFYDFMDPTIIKMFTVAAYLSYPGSDREMNPAILAILRLYHRI